MYPPHIAQQSFNIIEATWRDLGGVRHIEQECFGHDAWPLLEILAALSMPGNVHLKALVGTEIAGFVGGEIKGSERTGWITTVGVAMPYRRMGIGAALLKAGEDALGTHKLRLCVRQSNISALFMYWKTGYHQVDVWKNYYLGSEDALVLEKEV